LQLTVINSDVGVYDRCDRLPSPFMTQLSLSRESILFPSYVVSSVLPDGVKAHHALQQEIAKRDFSVYLFILQLYINSCIINK